MSDNNSKNNPKDTDFFDITFDEPIEDSRTKSNSTNTPDERSSNTKWDGFYEKFETEQKERYSDNQSENDSDSDFNTRREPNKPADTAGEKIESTKSSVMLNRSIKRVHKLFSEVNQSPQADYSKFKSAKRHDLKERAKLASLQTNTSEGTDKSQSNKIKRKFFKRPAVDNTSKSDSDVEVFSQNQSNTHDDKDYSDNQSQVHELNPPTAYSEDNTLNKNNPVEPSDNNHFSDLPSPEQLAAERERRRKLRVQQLEQMNSPKEIEDSYQSIPSSLSPSVDWPQPSEQVEQPISETTDLITESQSTITEDEEVNHNTVYIEENLDQATIDHSGDSEKPNELVLNLDEETNLDNDEIADLSDSTPTDEDLSSPDVSNSTLAAASIGLGAGMMETSSNPNLANIKPKDEDMDDSDSLDTPIVDTNLNNTSNEKTEKENERNARRKKRREKYSLNGFSWKDKTFFGINVTFNVIKRLLIYLFIIIVLVGALVGGAGIGYFANLVSKTPPPTEQEMAAQINHLEQQSTLYYGNGNPIADVRTDVVRSVANLDQISEYIVDGIIATEDEYFSEHPGIVPKALLRAVLETFISGSGTGGSTLTQQLVKQQMLTHDVTFFRKANEILLALRLENYFSKEDILTAYLNVSPFGRNNMGDNVAGIAEASVGVFGVAPSEVTLNQAAFLVGLPQDPYSYTPYDQDGQIRDKTTLQYGIERMNEVLYRMYREEKITRDEYDSAIAYDITQDFIAPESRPEERQTYLYQAVMSGAIEQLLLLNIKEDGYTWQQVYSDDDWYNEYYFAAEEQLRTGGYKVYSTIDKEIYDQLNSSAQAYEDQLGAVYDGVFTDPDTGAETYYVEEVQTGLVAIDNATGRVLGFVAGTDYENNQIDHAFTTHRSPGSTIKPMAVYGPAVDNNIVNPSTIIPDTAFVDESTGWAPTNYGEVVSDTLMTARTALLRSDNIPAARIYNELINQGVPIIDYLERMGFNTVDSYTEEQTQNLSFSLGGTDTGPTVLEQTRAFSTFANNGEYVDGYYIERIEDAFGNVVFQQSQAPQKVFSEDSNYLMVDMLRDTMTEGTGRTANENLTVPGDWIAKSGISENSKDIWFIASTPSITIGSWIGYDSRYAEHTFDINDGFDRESVRSQIYWSRIVNDLYAIKPEIFGTDKVFAQPDSVQEQTVLEQTGTLPGNFAYNGSTYQITGPTKTELFKNSNPAAQLTFDFMLGATEDELARFWNNVHTQQQEQQRQQQQQQQQNQSSSQTSNESGENAESSGDETTENPDENPESSDEVPPAESSETP